MSIKPNRIAALLLTLTLLSCAKTYYITPKRGGGFQDYRYHHEDGKLVYYDDSVSIIISGFQQWYYSMYSMSICSKMNKKLLVNDSSFEITDLRLRNYFDLDPQPYEYAPSTMGNVYIGPGECYDIILGNRGRFAKRISLDSSQLYPRNNWYDWGILSLRIFNPDSTVYRHLELYYIRDGIRKKLRSVSTNGVVFNKYEIELELLLDKPDMLFMQDESYNITANVRTKLMSKGGLQAKSKYFLSVDSLNIIFLNLGKVVQPPISEIRNTKGGHVYSFTNIKIPMEEDMLKIRFRAALTERETGLIWKIEHPFCRL